MTVARRLLALAALLGLGAAPAPARVDLLIRGGTIYPGGAAPLRGDIAVRGDRIVAIGPHLAMAAARVIDAHGMIVAPGFIDPHTHMGPELASADPHARLIPAFLLQGVTTAFIGNDGGGDPEVRATLATPATRPVGINFATYVGFGAVREKVMGEADRAPTAAELAAMRGLIAEAMCEGAMGLSTGLFYAPQSFSKTDEVVALAREAARRGGTYDSHIRDESDYTVGLAAAIDEAIAIGREAGLPTHISHIKALGAPVQGMPRRSSPRSRRRAQRAKPSPPTNIHGMLRARVSSPRSCRPGRRTAAGRRCSRASTTRRCATGSAPRWSRTCAGGAARRSSCYPRAARRWRRWRRPIAATRSRPRSR